MTGNRPKLIPCPFCGGEADYFYNADDGEVSDVTVSCTNLSCWFCIKDTDYVGSFPPCDTFEEAAELWNRRAGEMAEWTKEIDTDYSKIFIAHCNDGRKRLVEFVSNSFVVVNGNIRNGIDIFSFIDRYDQCRASETPFFFKQMSNKQPIPDDLCVREFPTMGGER